MKRNVPRFRPGSGGYTILEISWFSSSLVMAGFHALYSSVINEQRLQTVARKLEQMARAARHQARNDTSTVPDRVAMPRSA